MQMLCKNLLVQCTITSPSKVSGNRQHHDGHIHLPRGFQVRLPFDLPCHVDQMRALLFDSPCHVEFRSDDGLPRGILDTHPLPPKIAPVPSPSPTIDHRLRQIMMWMHRRGELLTSLYTPITIILRFILSCGSNGFVSFTVPRKRSGDRDCIHLIVIDVFISWARCRSIHRGISMQWERG